MPAPRPTNSLKTPRTELSVVPSTTVYRTGPRLLQRRLTIPRGSINHALSTPPTENLRQQTLTQLNFATPLEPSGADDEADFLHDIEWEEPRANKRRKIKQPEAKKQQTLTQLAFSTSPLAIFPTVDSEEYGIYLPEPENKAQVAPSDELRSHVEQKAVLSELQGALQLRERVAQDREDDAGVIFHRRPTSDGKTVVNLQSCPQTPQKIRPLEVPSSRSPPDTPISLQVDEWDRHYKRRQPLSDCNANQLQVPHQPTDAPQPRLRVTPTAEGWERELTNPEETPGSLRIPVHDENIFNDDSSQGEQCERLERRPEVSQVKSSFGSCNRANRSIRASSEVITPKSGTHDLDLGSPLPYTSDGRISRVPARSYLQTQEISASNLSPDQYRVQPLRLTAPVEHKPTPNAFPATPHTSNIGLQRSIRQQCQAGKNGTMKEMETSETLAVEGFPTDTMAPKARSSPGKTSALVRYPASSPVATWQEFAAQSCSDEGILTATQLLPESLMEFSLPAPSSSSTRRLHENLTASPICKCYGSMVNTLPEGIPSHWACDQDNA